MKKMLEVLRGARKIEIFAAMIAVSILLLQFSGAHTWTRGGTELERRLEDVLGRIEGVGSIDVMVTEGKEGAPEGVLVVAEGVENIGVYLKLQYAVKTLLGVDSSRIEIVRYG